MAIITAKTIYTIQHGNQSYQVEGVEGLKQYCDDIMGGLVDRMTAGNVGHHLTDKMNQHAFLMKSFDELDLIVDTVRSVKQYIDDITKDD
ncbi:hypothetical protein EJP02_526 [Escherichia phage EJP2]|nr:hypothetical protein EJP02_526 [Escherichia phage EJP2]